MGNVFTLDSLREEIEREFAPLQFEADGETFVLRNVLRLGSDERKAILEKLKEMNPEGESDEADPDEALEATLFVLTTVAADRKGAKLRKLIGDDLILAMKLMERWTEATQPGEAEPSES
jgi:hypothetical protein